MNTRSASSELVVTTSGVATCRRPRPSKVTANVVSFHLPTRGSGQRGNITGGPAETRSSRERLSQSRASPPRRNVPFSRRVLALSGGPSNRTAAARTGRVWVVLERNPLKRPLVPVGTPALRRDNNSAPQIKKEHHARQDRTPASQPKNAVTGPKLPVKTFRLGRIKAAVWENEADRKKFFNVTFARIYVDEARNYHDTDSYGRDDLPLVAKLAD